MSANLKLTVPDTPHNTSGHVVHFIIDVAEAVEIGLTILETAGVVHLAGTLGLTATVALPIAGYVGIFVLLGNAHADAQNKLIKDEVLSGFSRGVILGANGAKPSYVRKHFVKWSPVHNSVYPEIGKKLQNEYNRALVAGYVQGKALSQNQIGILFRDLHSRMSDGTRNYYYGGGGQWSNWGERTKREYYIDIAAIFKGYHLN